MRRHPALQLPPTAKRSSEETERSETPKLIEIDSIEVEKFWSEAETAERYKKRGEYQQTPPSLTVCHHVTCDPRPQPQAEQSASKAKRARGRG